MSNTADELAAAAGTPAGRISPRPGPPEIATVPELDADEDYTGMGPLAESPRLRPEGDPFENWDREDTAAVLASAVPHAPIIVPPPVRPARVATAPDRTASRAAKLSPQEDDMKDWASVKDTYDWVGIKPRDAALIASLLDLLRYEPDDPLIELASMEPADFDNDIKDWIINELPARAGDKTKARRLLHAARVFGGAEEPHDLKIQKADLQKRKEMDIAWFNAQPRVTKILKTEQRPSSSQSSAGATLHRRVNVRDIADELRNEEIPMVDKDDIDDLLRHWRRETKSKRDPPEDHEPSGGQLSVFAMYKRNKEVPYFNFAFFGPNGDRVMQRLLTVMWMLMPDGTPARQQFKGPANIMQWVSCWMVFQTGMIMYNLADYQTMVDYMEFIKDLAAQFGPACWAIIYQADARMRRAGLETIRRAASRLLDEAVDAEAQGSRLFVPRNPYEFVPGRPWEYCYAMAINAEFPAASKYWKKFVEIPCNKVHNQHEKVEDFLDTDAAISSHPNEHLATGGMQFDNSRIIRQPAPGRAPPVKLKADRPPKTPQDKNDKSMAIERADGIFVSNRAGVSLCGQFQHGNCKLVKGKCPKGQAHQCNKCLQNNHGASTCGTKIEKTKKTKK